MTFTTEHVSDISNSCNDSKILTVLTTCHPNQVALWPMSPTVGKSITGDPTAL